MILGTGVAPLCRIVEMRVPHSLRSSGVTMLE
jgi:hypothetical protein